MNIAMLNKTNVYGYMGVCGCVRVRNDAMKFRNALHRTNQRWFLQAMLNTRVQRLPF